MTKGTSGTFWNVTARQQPERNAVLAAWTILSIAFNKQREETLMQAAERYPADGAVFEVALRLVENGGSVHDAMLELAPVVGRRLTTAMRNAGLSVNQATALVDFDWKAIEAGDVHRFISQLTFERLQRVAILMRVSMSWLCGADVELSTYEKRLLASVHDPKDRVQLEELLKSKVGA